MKQRTHRLIQEDLDLLQSLNNSPNPESNIFVTVEHGYMRNLDHDVLQHLENTYRRTINPAFVLTFHCGTCILDMVRDLKAAYEQHMVQEQAVADAAAMDAAAAEQNPPTDPPAPATKDSAPPPPPAAPKAPKTPKATKGGE